MFFFVCSVRFLFAAIIFFFAAIVFCLQRSFFVCSDRFLFAAIVFCLQRIFFVCNDRFLFAAHLFCLQRSFFVCSASFLFATIVFCLQRIFFVCSDRFLFAACPLWAIVLTWDQDVAASPREFHETDNNRTNSAALLATWQYFSFRHIWFSKLLSHQKLSQIILSYFSNALSFEQGKRSFQISGKLSSFAKMTNKKIARHFEKHRCVT